VSGSLSQAEQAFDKALCLLGQNEGPKAEALLELVISAARRSSDQTLLARALCVLGEWLNEQGRGAEADAHLAQVVAMEPADPDLIAYEQRRARAILDSRGK
jgi:tetratricopeptide (TPR) repeat protein